MRIRRLEITGFGPYKDRQVVDFDDFAADGLFLITGKTGAGKSSILDAICFALYGTIPRFEGTQQRLRSDHCEADDPTSVELVFTVDDTDYRVRRSPEYDRPKKGRAGTTTQKPTAALDRLVGDTWIAIAARPVDAATEIAQIVGLTREQFLQVILLAQNRFQDFLLAKNDDRQRVLRSLFGTRRFLDVEVALVERRKKLDDRLGDARDALSNEAARAAGLLELDEGLTDVPVSWFDDALTGLTADRDAAAAESVAADAAHDACESGLRAVEETARRQARRGAAIDRLAELALGSADLDADRLRLAAARRADAVHPHAEALEEAESALASAAADRVTALERFPDGADTAALPSFIDESTRLLGNLEGVLEAEQTLPVIDTEIVGHVDRVRLLDARIADLTDADAALPARIGTLAADLERLRLASATAGDATDRVTLLESRSAAAREAAELAPRHEAALVAESAAAADYAESTRAIQDLLERRLTGHAGELAAALIDGGACGVCGSTVHPLPATISIALVTEADVDGARAEAESARTAAHSAHDTRAELAVRLADASVRSRGESAAVIDEELVDARARQAEAVAATLAATATATELDDARAEHAGAEAAIEAARDEHAVSAAELLRSSTRRSGITDRVEQSRGGFASIGERVAHLLARVGDAQALAKATSDVGARAAVVDTAGAALDGQLAIQGFADARSVSAARLDSRAAATLESSIRAADDAAAVATATLADSTLSDLPAEPVDPVPAAEAVRSARSARDAAVSTHRSLSSRVDQLARVVVTAHRMSESSAALLDEFRQLRELSSAVEGNEPNDKRMRLETYVLAARLEEIVAAANARLRTMTGGRYALEHDDALQFRGLKSGLGLAIRDEHSGRARATHSLSGGETFLASLALALGLAEVVTNQAGGIRLDTLFIDEGFGSLDGDTLEIAMSTLDSLRSGGRTIGLISHVDAMKEQIPAKLRITVGDRGHSRIEGSYELA